MSIDNSGKVIPDGSGAFLDYCIGRQEELLELLREALPYIKRGPWPLRNDHVRTLAARMEKQLGG